MNKLGLLAGGAALLLASAAHADLINMGESASTGTFTSTGTGALSFSAASGFIFNSANFQAPTGTVDFSGTGSLGAMSITTGTESGGVFPITSGGTIPENADYRVHLEPDNHVIGSVNEDFAVESMAGDIFQLGNKSYRIRRVERGIVRVEDAHGMAPTIPFWLGEAPGRSDELSDSVSRLRAAVAERLQDDPSGDATMALAAEEL